MTGEAANWNVRCTHVETGLVLFDHQATFESAGPDAELTDALVGWDQVLVEFYDRDSGTVEAHFTIARGIVQEVVDMIPDD